MKRLGFSIMILFFLISISFGAMTNSSDAIKPGSATFTTNAPGNSLKLFTNEVETQIEAWTIDSGTTLTFPTYGLTIDNASASVLCIKQGAGTAEDLLLTFSSNTGTLSSSTDLALLDFGCIRPKVTSLYILEGGDSPVYTTSFVGGDQSANVAYTLPVDDGTNGQLLKTDGSGVLSWTSAGAGTVTNLDDAYNGSAAVTVDGDAITLTVTNTSNNRGLDVVQNDTTNNPEAVRLTNTGSGDTLQFVSTGGKDVNGSGSAWSVTSAGAGTFASVAAPTFTGSGAGSVTTGSAGLILSNGATITNATNTEIKFTEDNGTANEDLSFDFLADEIDLKSTSGVATLGFGDIDNLTGINWITFDATSSYITLDADSAGDDLYILLAGIQDASLILASTGTPADAIRIEALNGGIDISAAGATAGEDIDISNTGASVNITSTEAITDAIVLTASNAIGGIDITSGADIDITTTGAADEDISLINAGGSINIEATESDAAAIVLHASGAAGGITIDFNTGNLVITGTGASADTTIDCDLLSIDGTGVSNVTVTSNAGSEDFTVALAGATDSSLILSSTGTAEDALQISASAGGINMSSTTDPIDITVNADGAADDLTLNIVGAQDSSIIATSAGTGVDAIKLNATAGGVDIDGKDDVIITCASTTTDDDLSLIQTGAFAAGINLQSAGTGTHAISLQSLAGGLDVDAKDDIIVTVASTASGDNLALVQTGAVAGAGITLTAAGTANNTISLQAAAGGVDIDGKDDVTINVASTTTGDNLALAQTGAFAAGITLAAAGTGDDAIDLAASAGGIDIDAVKSVTIESTENTSDAVVISTTLGGIDITCGGQAGGTEDLDLSSALSSVKITSGEATADAIVIDAFTDAGGGIDVDFGTGDLVIVGNTAGADMTIDTDLFSIDGTGTANITVTGSAGEDFTISQAGAADASLFISSTGTAADALTISTSAGGMDLTVAGAAANEDMDLLSNSSINITATEAVANQIYLQGQGTIAGNAVNIATTDGGIIINAGGAANGDVTIQSGDDIALTSTGTMAIDSVDWDISATGAATNIASVGFDSSSVIYHTTVELSNAEIKGLAASPKELVATPGANYFLELVSVFLIMDYGTNVFTVNAGDDLVVEYGGGQNATASIETTGFLDQAADQMAFYPAATIATATAANISNNNLRLFNIGVEIAGNAANNTTMTVKIAYRIHPDGL